MLGEITVRKTSRASRISVHVRPCGEVRLTLPHRVSVKDGLGFVDSKADWIAQTRRRLAEKYPEQIIAPTYLTRMHRLDLRPAERENINVRIGEGVIAVTYPSRLDVRHKSVQTAVRRGIEAAWRIEARQILPARVAELSERTGLVCRSVTVRCTVSKWGSCSARNDLSLSLHLMRLPDHLIDYIILHELCHTVHKNHGQHFHEMLDKLTDGRHRALNRELREYRTRW